MTDTIAAIATPYGSGGIGVIRISGPRSFEIAQTVFSCVRGRKDKGPKLKTHRVYHGYIQDKTDVIDEVLLIPMKGPRSYTAEDVVEIQAHSGAIVLRRILNLLVDLGARLAEPGEFTKRAFLNGRIDLTQAEAVADIINARSDSALKFAASQNLGTLKDEISKMKEILTDFLSRLEASIDFPDETGLFSFSDKDRKNLCLIIEKSKGLIQQHKDACFLKTGIRVAICGQPNVGKSSLMNQLLDKEKSIITPIPGTTRDPIEEGINIEGIPFVVIDTAGIHETDDLVEIIGIEKARDHIAAADIILYMSEPGLKFNENTFSKIIPPDKKVIYVINKMDLAEDADLGVSLPEKFAHIPIVKISALMNHGIDALRQCLMEYCIRNLDMENDAVIPNLRHKNALGLALNHMEALFLGMDSGQEEETLAIEAKNSIDFLGTITGETASIDILDAIFNNFCIGK
ncbi:MAG: tRNA uridine-5-carboxymethylaminomethyl(34) synthesis GTPase MnmE [Desulfobacter sp.]|nr:tRNA uridine-5-carboxymethylaminomethyl(34) synthesis GTPase MnmE [Desulfobacter sp.]WDP84695.1 MAG: tRNA uridine-5-carboxymethylaminomethyl(34) synthesis GTPase MnmE [Desulfobacter sp.]